MFQRIFARSILKVSFPPAINGRLHQDVVNSFCLTYRISLSELMCLNSQYINNQFVQNSLWLESMTPGPSHEERDYKLLIKEQWLVRRAFTGQRYRVV